MCPTLRPRTCNSSCLACLVALVALVPQTVDSGLFDAFPRVDDGQLAVHDGDILQVIGTATASSIVSALRNARDVGFQPLIVASENTEKPQRALLSVGIADFYSTSAGAYRELVIAFPACETDEAPVLECTSFNTCQSQLPDCAQTYMFRSFVSKQAALWVVRSFGVDAQLAAVFDFKHEPGDIIRFSILGPGNSEIFQGSVKKSNRAQSSSKDSGATGNLTRKLPKDGYDVHPYVGIPGVLGPGQARYLCAFSKAISVESVATAGPLHAGKLLAEFDFKPEGIFHLANASVMQFPPMGYQKADAKAGSVNTAPARPASTRPAAKKDASAGVGLMELFSGGHIHQRDGDGGEVEGCLHGCDERIPWKRQDAAPEKEKDMLWNAYNGATPDSPPVADSTATRRPRSSSPNTRSGGQRSPKSADVGLATLLSEL